MFSWGFAIFIVCPLKETESSSFECCAWLALTSGFHLELGCLLSDWAQPLNSTCVFAGGGYGGYRERQSTRQGFGGQQRSYALENGTPKKVFVPIGLFDVSGFTGADWPELGNTEAREVGD